MDEILRLNHIAMALVVLFEMVFEVSQSLALVGQPTRIGQVWRIVIGHSTLLAIHLLIYKLHMVHEND